MAKKKKAFPKTLYVTNNNSDDSDQYFNPNETIGDAVENYDDYCASSTTPVIVAEYKLVGKPFKVKKAFSIVK